MAKKGWGVAQRIECLLNKSESPSSNPRAIKKKKVTDANSHW
jgi:hypothetical protein